jgi:hypothetical protein
MTNNGIFNKCLKYLFLCYTGGFTRAELSYCTLLCSSGILSNEPQREQVLPTFLWLAPPSRYVIIEAFLWW